MRARIWTIGAAALFIVTQAASAQQSQPAQDQKPNPPAATQQQQPSLADAARKAREQKKTEPKPAQVFTNDNLPAGGVNVVGDTSAAAQSAPSGENTPSSEAASGEKEWRGRFAKARAKLSRDQADLDVMQREFGKLSVQYYSDPTKQLMQSITNEEINKQRAKIDAKKADVAADQQAISDLEDSLRKAGGDPGWAR
jgi:hypothetical protein